MLRLFDASSVLRHVCMYAGRNTDWCVPRMDVKPVNVSEGVIYRTIIFVGFIFNFIDFSGPGLYYRLETAYGI